jgi:hypothetical protein
MSSKEFGPEWYQDKTRPEAIVALSQMAESYKLMSSLPRNESTNQEQTQTSPDSAAKHFRLAAMHLCLALSSLLDPQKILPNQAGPVPPDQSSPQTKRSS